VQPIQLLLSFFSLARGDFSDTAAGVVDLTPGEIKLRIDNPVERLAAQASGDIRR